MPRGNGSSVTYDQLSELSDLSTLETSAIPTAMADSSLKPQHATSQLLKLAGHISDLTGLIQSRINNTSQSEPSFGPHSVAIEADAELEDLRARLNDAADDLLLLVNGPKVTFRRRLGQHFDLAAYQTAFEFDLFGTIADGTSSTLAEIADRIGLDQDRTGRILRFLATQRVFNECHPNIFEHTACSALLARDHVLKETFHMQMDEIFAAASDSGPAIRQSPESADASSSPFVHRHGMTIWDYYKQHPQKGIRFGTAMEGATKLDRKVTELRDEFDWSSLGSGKVVDVGGGNGTISVSLAKKFPMLNFVVQDISDDLLDAGREHVAADTDLQRRISFQKHSFFEPQPIRDAVAFFTRQTLYNWADADCVKIFQSFVPALEECQPGTPLLLNETILPRPMEKSRFEEHTMRQVDMSMMIILGSRQRTEDDFRQLLGKADKRLQIFKVHATGAMGLIEVRLRPKLEN